jgi:hypothetical protein
VAHNTSTGWAFGLFLRDARQGTAEDNRLARNCIGALVLATGAQRRHRPPRRGLAAGGQPGRPQHPLLPGPGRGGAPPLGGLGVAVVGADDVRILRNRIRGNNPPAEGRSDLPPSGVAVLDGTLVGSEPAKDVLVAGNRFRNDLDISWDRSGAGIRFRGNRCRTSFPARAPRPGPPRPGPAPG